MHLLSKLHAMKGYCFLIFCGIICYSESFGQTISLSVEKKPLEKVFLLIEKQSSYNFVYSREAINHSRPVTVNVKNESLEKVLQLCFANQPLTYLIEEKHIVVRLNLPSETSSSTSIPTDIKGKVLNESGEPVAGITVAVKGTEKITTTDNKGEFLLSNITVNAVLQISGAEIEPMQVVAGGQNYITVSVKPRIGTLDETIVIAYGKTTRRHATGTVAKVSREEIQRQPISNPLAALTGRVAGLQVTQGSGMPGSSYTVRLRGQNSIANGNDPMFIVDGVPFPSGTLNGTLGGGGGITNSPLNSINANDIESIEVLKDADATAIYGSRGANGVIIITTKKGKAGKTKVEVKASTSWGKITRYMKLLNTPQYLEMRKEAFANDGVTPNATNAKDLVLWDSTRYTDWQKVLMGNTLRITDINTNVSGGNLNTQFLIGTGYNKQSTVLPGNFEDEKVSANFTINHQSESKKFQISLSGNYLNGRNILPPQDVTTATTLPPNSPLIYDSIGRFNWENSTWENPLAALERVFKTNTENLIVNSSISYLIMQGLQLKASFGHNRITQSELTKQPMSSNNPAWNLLGAASFGNNAIRTIVFEPQVNFDRSFAKNHLEILAGYTIQSGTQEAVYQVGSGYTSDNLLNSKKAAAVLTTSSETSIKYRYLGVFSRINYDYGKKYFLTVTARRDGSSRYGPDNRFSNFGSLGLAWIFTKEKVFSNSTFLTFGKIKGSAGITGNDQIGDYKYLDTYSTNSFSYLSVSTFQPTQLYNPNYSWEKVRKLEAGIELGFYHDRHLLSLNYYRNTTRNQLISYALPATTGFSGVLKNLPAKILNQGLEIEVNSNIIKTRQFDWNVSFNLSLPQNKLLSFDHIESSTYANTYVVGRSLFISRRYTYKGLDSITGAFTFFDVNGDNKISSPADLDAVVFTGQKYFGGLQNTMRFKNLSLSFLFQFVKQENGTSYSTRFVRPGTLGNQPITVLSRWKNAGSNTEFQKVSNSNSILNTAYSNYRSSSAFFSDVSFIRLRNLELSWLVSGKKSMQILKECNFFLSGHNLLTITKYKGWDPETKSSLPASKIVTLGVKLSI